MRSNRPPDETFSYLEKLPVILRLTTLKLVSGLKKITRKSAIKIKLLQIKTFIEDEHSYIIMIKQGTYNLGGIKRSSPQKNLVACTNPHYAPQPQKGEWKGGNAEEYR